jgi:hypothetical protein
MFFSGVATAGLAIAVTRETISKIAGKDIRTVATVLRWEMESSSQRLTSRHCPDGTPSRDGQRRARDLSKS